MLLLSCKSASVIQHAVNAEGASGKVDSVFLEIRALDLTEDMSPLSSQNDEIVMLVYDTGSSAGEIMLLLGGSFTVTKENNLRSIAAGNLTDFAGELTIVMLERDTDHSVEQLDEMVRLHFGDLLKHYQRNGNFGIEKFIDDNDIVGIKTIASVQPNMTVNFDFKGIFKLDKYHYKLIFSTR
ncbi:MAG: hypothetical protein KIT62_17825 [Cyclobacteriaceae bacterium]|nr:hypothetical protein [Cyclobacteriaceae bacterium]